MIRFFQGLFSSMSLERKCLLFFGSALLVLMSGAFLVVEMLGRRLVENTTLTRARDYSGSSRITSVRRIMGKFGHSKTSSSRKT